MSKYYLQNKITVKLCFSEAAETRLRNGQNSNADTPKTRLASKQGHTKNVFMKLYKLTIYINKLVFL